MAQDQRQLHLAPHDDPGIMPSAKLGQPTAEPGTKAVLASPARPSGAVSMAVSRSRWAARAAGPCGGTRRSQAPAPSRAAANANGTGTGTGTSQGHPVARPHTFQPPRSRIASFQYSGGLLLSTPFCVTVASIFAATVARSPDRYVWWVSQL